MGKSLDTLVVVLGLLRPANLSYPRNSAASPRALPPRPQQPNQFVTY